LKAGIRPLCYTINSIDTGPAKKISEILNLNHVHVTAENNPIGSNSEVIDQFNEIKKEAVYVTGGCGELARAFYYKKSKRGKTRWGTVLANYLSTKKIALISSSKIKLIEALLLERWNKIGEFDKELKCDNVDSLYVDRIRTWYSEAFSDPRGPNHIPFLVGPAMNAYGKSFSLEERRDGIPHKELIHQLSGVKLPPILNLIPSKKLRFFQSLPDFFQVFFLRSSYIFSKEFLNNLALAKASVFDGIFSFWEEAILKFRCRKDYQKVRNILLKAQRINPQA
jgi:hypothetical protein